MEQEEIRNIIITSIFGNDNLFDKLTLKGGNALALQGISQRASQDLDFSINEGLQMDKEKYEPIFKKALEDGFNEHLYQVINFSFTVKPQKTNEIVNELNRQNISDQIIWGGYHIKFGIIDKSKYDMLVLQGIDNIGTRAENTWGNKKNIEIDISKNEYTEPRKKIELDGFTVYIYTPLMIVYEKIRASCQQLPGYKINGTKKRARDLFDIYELMASDHSLREDVVNKENIYILKKMFNLKGVPYKLLTQLAPYKEVLQSDYVNKVLPQIEPGKEQQFDFLFNYAVHLFNDIYKLVCAS